MCTNLTVHAFGDQWELKETCVYVYMKIYKKVK